MHFSIIFFLMYNRERVITMKDNKTLLEGNISRQLIVLAIPLLVGNILQQLYNAADSLIVGHFLGTDAFASVGISGTVMNLFIFILNGFCMGLSIIFSRLYGAGESKRFREEVFVAIGYGTLATILLGGLFMTATGAILRLIGTPGELIPYARAYLFVILAGLPFTYFYNLFSGILRSIGNTRAALYFLAIAIAANVILDCLFIAGFHAGTAGAAAATVLSQLLSAICCFFYIKIQYPDLLCRREDFGLHLELLSQTLRFGITSALQESSLYIGKILVQGAVNTLGTPGIAAYTATMRIEGLANSFGDSCANAMSVLISQNLGAGNRDRVRGGLVHGLRLNVCLAVILSALMFVGSAAGIRLFLSDSDALPLAHGVSYLKTVSFFYILCFTGCSFVGYFRGTGRLHVPFLCTTIHITLRVILSYLLVDRLGLSAIAVATGLGWLLAVSLHISFYFHYRRKDRAA